MESCLDFRKLNDVTVGDSFPIPNITDILDSLGKSKYFSTIDCANGFWQIPVREEDRQKIAFSTEYGHFECKSMPFGLNGAILSQGQIGQDLPIDYARTLDKAERNYFTTEKELLAIVWACEQYRPYLYGKKFTIVTDHKPLTWVFSVKDPSSRFLRWRLKLEEYNYQVIYKPGVRNNNADALRRITTPKVNHVVKDNSDFK